MSAEVLVISLRGASAAPHTVWWDITSWNFYSRVASSTDSWSGPCSRAYQGEWFFERSLLRSRWLKSKVRGFSLDQSCQEQDDEKVVSVPVAGSCD